VLVTPEILYGYTFNEKKNRRTTKSGTTILEESMGA
jgi:hypothetical protein